MPTAVAQEVLLLIRREAITGDDPVQTFGMR